MATWSRLIRGALLFDTATFIRLRNRADAFLQGVFLIVVVALLAGLPAFVVDVANGLRSQSESARASGFAEMEENMQQMAPLFEGMPAEEMQQIMTQMRQGFEAAQEIGSRAAALPTVLPRPVGAGLEALGAWLSRPFAGSLLPLFAATLGTWLGYGLWVLLAARLLGGHGDLVGFFGTTSLFAVPHLLNVLGVVPVLGPLVAFVAFIWGLAIYVKATAISQELTLGRAILAAALPFLVVVALLIVVGFGLTALIALSGGGQ